MQKVLKELFDQFVKKNGREPDNLEMILLRQKASAEDIRKRKIISMFDRSPVDADKPILGGQNIEETDTQILERLNKGNENSLSNIRYENAIKAEEAKAAADENYIMQVFDPEDFSDGGRAGYYGGGQAMVGEDLSQIGHGADALMARNMQLAPNSMATTSTGLNYLLGEDNDTVRVPYNEGKMVLPKPKPAQSPLVELSRIYKTYEDAMPGVSKDTQQYLQQDFIQKLNDAGISQEAFMTYKMQNNFADGGRAAFGGGGTMGASDKGYQGGGRNKEGSVSGTAPGAAAVGGGPDDRGSPQQNLNHLVAMHKYQNPQPQDSKIKNILNTGQEINYLNNLYKMNIPGLAIGYGINRFGPSIMEKLKNLRSQAEIEEEDGIMQMAGGYTIPTEGKFGLNLMDYGTLNDAGYTDGQIEELQNNPNINTEEVIRDIKGPIFAAAEGGPARQNFKMGRRAFLGLMGSVAGGIAGLKSGILNFTKGGGKKVATEVAKEAATGGPPPYFLNLVNKIKKMGDDTLATQDKAIAKKYKDYTMQEDFAGNIEIIKKGDDVAEDVFMSYKVDDVPVKGKKGSKKVEEYEEYTATPDAEGKMKNIEQGVPDEVVQEGTVFEDTLSEFGKADGGRIGYAGGKKVVDAIIKKANKKLGKKAVTTADKADIPKETLLRDMFTDTNKRLNKKREMTTDEYDDFVEEVGGEEQLEAYNFDGTVGDAERILKEQEDYMAYMYDQYRTGKLDPVAGDKSPARKRFLEQKLADMEASGDKRLMTREEIEELSTFNLDEDIDISQGMIDLDEMNFTKNAQAAKNKMDNMDVNQKIKEGVASIMSDTSPAALEKSIEIDNLMLKYPGMDKNLADQIASSSPTMKADLIAMVEQTFKMDEMGMSGDDIIQTFKNTTRTKQATGGLASILR